MRSHPRTLLARSWDSLPGLFRLHDHLNTLPTRPSSKTRLNLEHLEPREVPAAVLVKDVQHLNDPATAFIPFGSTSTIVSLGRPVAMTRALVTGSTSQPADWAGNTVVRFELVDTNGSPATAEAVQVSRGKIGGYTPQGDLAFAVDVTEFESGVTVERKLVTLGSSATSATAALGTSWVSDRSFVVLSQSTTDDTPNNDARWSVRGSLTGGGSTLTLTRGESGSEVVVAAQVLTLDAGNGSNVQSGLLTLSGTTASAGYATTAGAGDLLFFSSSVPASTSGIESKYRVRGTAAGGTASFATLAAGGATVNYFVVSVAGATVQTGTLSFAAATTDTGGSPSLYEQKASILHVDPARSFVQVTVSGGDSARRDTLGDTAFKATLSDGKTVVLTRADRTDAPWVPTYLNGSAKESVATAAWSVVQWPKIELAPLGLARNGSVRAGDGAVGVDAVDLWSGGFGMPWGQSRTWTNDPRGVGYAGNQWFGNGWVANDLPSLVRDGTTIKVVQGTDALTFDVSPDGTGYVARFFVLDTLVRDAASKTFTLTRTDGTRIVFRDFDSSWPAASRGQFDSHTSPAAFATAVTSRTEDGKPLVVTRSGSGAGQGLTVESYTFEWVGNRAASVTLERFTVPLANAVVRKVVYTYYGAGDSQGNEGDLKTAEVRDAAGTVLDTMYYRYHTGGSGGLKMAFGPAAFERLKSASAGNPFGATDGVASAFADLAFTYNADKQVATRTVAGAGSTGQGTTTYAYTSSGRAVGYNNWDRAATAVLPDGTQTITYANAFAEPMLAAVTDGGSQWVTYTQYDSAGRAVLTANPSAVTGYDPTKADLVNFVSGNAQYLLDTGGLITVTSYYGSTGGGGVAGYYAGTSLRKGEFGTPVPQNATTYATHTDSGVTVHPVASTTIYRNDNGTGAQTTAFDYEWFPGTVQAKVIDTTPPVISAAENGSGLAVRSSTVFDSFGRAEWTQDTAGVVSRTTRDLATGAVTSTVQDVAFSTPDIPAAFEVYGSDLFELAPAALAWTGKNRETLYEVDSLGRTTRVRDANHNVTYTTYNDPAHEIRTYRGWLGSTLTGPVEVMREDRGRGYVETYTSSALPDVVGGRPTGTELPVLESLSRRAMNAAGQTISTDVYFNLDGLAYSPGAMGAAGANFYRTAYGYDAAGRPDRVTSPGLTTDTTVFDGLGRVVSTWTESIAAAMAKTQVSAFQYDNGGLGDSNRTATTLYPGGGADPRVTRAWFDWRNRHVAEKQGAQSSENAAVNRPLTYAEFNNLGEPVVTSVYDGDGVTPVDANADGTPDAPAAALLRGTTVTSFNTWGQAYRTTDIGVNPLTGALATVPLVTDTWFDLRGMATKTQLPGGRVEKTQFDGLGQLTSWFNASGGGSSSWSDALTVANDRVLTQVDYEYDDVGNSTRTTTRTQFDGVSIVGNLSGQSGVRVTTTGAFYDAADRLTDTVDVGTNGLLSLSQAPPRSDDAHVTSYQYDSGGRVEIVTDSLGRQFFTAYDTLGRPTAESLAFGTPDAWTTFYGYDYSGRLESVTQPGGRTTFFGYDGFERQNSVTLPMGRTFTTAFNSLGQSVASTDAEGSVAQTLYDTLGRAISVTAAFGSSAAGTVTAAHDVFGRVIQATDERGKVTSTLFNDADRTTTVTDAVGKLWTSYTDLAGNLTKSVDPLGKAWESVFDIWNRFTSSKDPLGNTTQQKYLVAGNQYVTIDARNNESAIVVDNFDRSAQSKDAAGKGSTSTFDRGNRTKTVTDAMGAITEYQYDNLNRVRVMTEAKGAPEQRETVYDYDAKGDLFSVITPNGYQTFSLFDDAGRVVERTVANATAESLVTGFAYDKMNRVTLLTAPGDRQTKTNYDKRGRVTDVTTGYGTPLARTTSRLYDAAGNLEYLSEPLGRITEYVYDEKNRVVSVVDPSGGVTQTTYDDAGRRKTLTDPVGNATTWGYDDAGRMTRETDRFGLARVTDYDPAGNVIAVTDRNGEVRSYGYDERDRKISETWYIGPAIIQVQGYGYDDNGNLTSATDPDGSYTLTHDKLNRVKTVAGPFGVSWTFGYDGDGNRTSAADNKGGVTVTGYDGLDRPVSRTASVGGDPVAEIGWTYDPDTGDLTRLDRAATGGANVATIFAHDTLGRQTSVSVSSPAGGTTFVTGYDAADRVTSETRDGVTRTFGYDDTDQLTSDNGVSRGYDPNGNRTDAGYVQGPGNRLHSDGEWTYGYDAEGRRVSKAKPGEAWEYGYDHRGQMVRATKTDGLGGVLGEVVYAYDAWGNRIHRTETDVFGAVVSDERFAVDGWDTAKPGAIGTENFDVAMDLNGNGDVTARRMYGPGFDDVLGKVAGGVVTWYVTDRQHSVRGTVATNGGFGASVNYDAFGNVIAGVLDDRYSYTGREYDAAVDLYHYRWRMLNARTGLFTSQDSLEREINPYRYAGNSPTNRVDPSGMWWFAEASMWNGEPAEKMRAALGKAGIHAYLIDSNQSWSNTPEWRILYVPKRDRPDLKAWLKAGYRQDITGFANLLDADAGMGNLRFDGEQGFTTADLTGITEADRATIARKIEEVERNHEIRYTPRIAPRDPNLPPIRSNEPIKNPIEPIGETVFGVIDSGRVLANPKTDWYLNKHLRAASRGDITPDDMRDRMFMDATLTGLFFGGPAAGLVERRLASAASVSRRVSHTTGRSAPVDIGLREPINPRFPTDISGPSRPVIRGQEVLTRRPGKGPGAMTTPDRLDALSRSEGPTVDVYTRLSSAPHAGREVHLSLESRALADSLPNSTATQVYHGKVPKTLIDELEHAGLAARSTTQMGGVVGIELEVYTPATEWIVPFLRKIP